ncbi:hypothetical protein ACFY5C_07475 [Streptomyces sp. NPDC012935]|uniref:hypothetical protein n=1 Tax=Streptomyces sp. NPDC012935 TaxID=3364857 RepID=UPI003686A167
MSNSRFLPAVEVTAPSRSSVVMGRMMCGQGAGRRTIEPVRVVATLLATHLKYRVVK